MSQKPSLFAAFFNWSGRYIGCAAILSTLLGGTAGFGVGLFYAELRAYQRQREEEQALIDPILATDPAFAEVKSSPRSSGGIDLWGTVPTQADHDRRRERVIRAVGESRANEIVRGVSIHR